MRFSICIPTYNRAKLISRCLNSLISQTFSDFEVLVIDDGSIDNTKDIVETYCQKDRRINYYYKKNGGKYTALNLGIEKSIGEYFIILDSDDFLLDNALERMNEFCKLIDENDEYSGIATLSGNLSSGKIIGDSFPHNEYKFSYITMHYDYVINRNYKDLFECNKTSIIKKFHYPLDDRIKFIPESYIFDQIGLSFYLIGFNEILQIKEYQENGITKDENFMKKNADGFIINYINKIENIIPAKKGKKLKYLIIAWWRYWTCVSYTKGTNLYGVKKITFLGKIVKTFTPLLTLIAKVLLIRR